MNHSKNLISIFLSAAMLFGTMVTSVHASDEAGSSPSSLAPRLRTEVSATASTPVLAIYGGYAIRLCGDWFQAVSAAVSGLETEGEEASEQALSSEAAPAVSNTASFADGSDFYAGEAVPATPESTEAAPSAGEIIAATAQEYLGCDYVYGGSSPEGFDCSGFTQYVMALCGYTIRRGAGGQVNDGVPVSRDELLPGDLVFFSEDFTIDDVSHVGLYIGGGQFIHAAVAGIGVVITDMDASWYSARYVGARRVW